MTPNKFEDAVRVVSTLLYVFDPEGMGRAVFAPADEYDDPARILIRQSRGESDLRSLVIQHYEDAEPPLMDSLTAALRLYAAAAPEAELT